MTRTNSTTVSAQGSTDAEVVEMARDHAAMLEEWDRAVERDPKRGASDDLLDAVTDLEGRIFQSAITTIEGLATKLRVMLAADFDKRVGAEILEIIQADVERIAAAG